MIGAAAILFMFYSNSEAAVKGTSNSIRVFGAREYWMHNLADGMLVAGILFSVFALLYCCLIFKNFKHIKTAIYTLDASADFSITHKRVMAIALGYFLLILGTFICWLYLLIYILSTNVTMDCPKDIMTSGACFKKFSWSITSVLMIIFSVIAYLWLVATLKLCCKFFIMCSAATYYFNSDDEMEGSGEVMQAFQWTHL